MAESEAGSLAKKRKADALWCELRQVQRKTGCTNITLKETFKTFTKLFPEEYGKPATTKPGKGGDASLLKKSGARSIRLDGCVGCNDHVFLPSEKKVFCPKCRHPRFNAEHKPNEVCCCC